MLILYCFAAIIACFVSNSSAASNPCSSIPYASLSCLTNNKAAASACSSQLSTIPVNVAVAVIADDAVETVTVTKLYTSTVIITTSSFAYSISASTIMATITKTTYVPTNSPAARRLKGRDSACTVSKALKSLSGMSSANLATACSCIGATIPASPNPGIKITGTTSTITVSAGLTITSFVNVGATTRFAQTVTSTTTATLTLAAPTYSHVYAATAGCQDTPTVDTLQLDPSITDKNTAVAMCQGACSQNGKCASLLVQYLFPSYGDTAPVYKCFMNGQAFDELSSLICGLSVDVWGAADAFDVIGRGVPI